MFSSEGDSIGFFLPLQLHPNAPFLVSEYHAFGRIVVFPRSIAP